MTTIHTTGRGSGPILVSEAGDRKDYPGLPRVRVNRYEERASLPSGGTYFTSITFTVEAPSVCPICDGPICEESDEAVYRVVAKVVIEPSPPVGDEHPWRTRVSQDEHWLTDHEVVKAVARCLEYAAGEIKEWSE